MELIVEPSYNYLEMLGPDCCVVDCDFCADCDFCGVDVN